MGSKEGGLDVHNSGSLGSDLSREVDDLPMDGKEIYVRLWFKMGGKWTFEDFSYKAAA